MDKVTLNREQLQEVVAYIERRGFKDPLVLVEILDHFACKVEEKMEARPGMALGAAIVAAHSDFGPMGFYPLRKAFEEAAAKKYSAIFNNERKLLLKSPLFVLLTIVLSFLFTRVVLFFPFRSISDWYPRLPVMEVLCWGYLAAQLLLISHVPRRLRGSAVVKAVTPNTFLFLFISTSTLSRLLVGLPDEIGTISSLAGALFFYLVLDVFSTKNSLKHAIDEGAVVDNYLRRLQSA
ncbi:MAG: hypothetical protein KF744_10850 [Taibaiella sp.]|nr:hypothetical protein [Taibaiella sp.]